MNRRTKRTANNRARRMARERKQVLKAARPLSPLELKKRYMEASNRLGLYSDAPKENPRLAFEQARDRLATTIQTLEARFGKSLPAGVVQPFTEDYAKATKRYLNAVLHLLDYAPDQATHHSLLALEHRLRAMGEPSRAARRFLRIREHLPSSPMWREVVEHVRPPTVAKEEARLRSHPELKPYLKKMRDVRRKLVFLVHGRRATDPRSTVSPEWKKAFAEYKASLQDFNNAVERVGQQALGLKRQAIVRVQTTPVRGVGLELLTNLHELQGRKASLPEAMNWSLTERIAILPEDKQQAIFREVERQLGPEVRQQVEEKYRERLNYILKNPAFEYEI